VLDSHPYALSFAERRGFRSTEHGEQFSRLDVRKANLDGYEGVEERLRGEGIVIRTLAELGTEDKIFMQALYELNRDSHADIPSDVRHEFASYDQWLKIAMIGHGRPPEWCWVALHKEKSVGIARLRLAGNNAAWNAYMGVHRACRGKGIARALKLRAIEWSREHGVAYHYTGNDAENHRMLAINLWLGYQLLPRDIELKRELEAIAE